MSYSVDANILLYASDRLNPRYDAARAFMSDRTSDPDLLCLSWPTVMAYLRIATHPAIFTNPLTPQEALANIQALVDMPRTKLLSEEEGFLEVYQQVTGDFPVRGNLVPDAHLAAILNQHGVRVIYTNDRDFLRFDFLEVRDPFP